MVHLTDGGTGDSTYALWEATAVPTVSRPPGRVIGSVHDFLAGSVNRNGSDVLEIGYTLAEIYENNNPTQ